MGVSLRRGLPRYRKREPFASRGFLELVPVVVLVVDAGLVQVTRFRAGGLNPRVHDHPHQREEQPAERGRARERLDRS